jgi:hypothetical protein
MGKICPALVRIAFKGTAEMMQIHPAMRADSASRFWALTLRADGSGCRHFGPAIECRFGR